MTTALFVSLFYVLPFCHPIHMPKSSIGGDIFFSAFMTSDHDDLRVISDSHWLAPKRSMDPSVPVENHFLLPPTLCKQPPLLLVASY
jgi:hypothetical protein